MPVRAPHGAGDHHDGGAARVPPAALTVLGPVDDRAEEHHGEDDQALPQGNRAVGGDQRERQHPTHHTPEHAQRGPPEAGAADGHDDGDRGEHDQRTGADPVGEGGDRQQDPCQRAHHGEHGQDDRDRRRPPVQADGEQRDDHQVEGHLVGQRPQDEQEVGCPQQLLEQADVGDDRRGDVVAREVAVLRDAHRGGGEDRGGDRHPQRVDAEHPAGPERPHTAPPLQRRRDDVAAHQEEHHDAVPAGVEHRHQVPTELRQVGVRRVVEHHHDRGDAAQRVQPAQPRRTGRGRPRRNGGQPLGRGGGRGFHACPDAEPTAGVVLSDHSGRAELEQVTVMTGCGGSRSGHGQEGATEE